MKTKSQALCPAVAKQRRYLKETHKTCCFTLELYSHSRQAETRRQHSAHTRRRKETQAATRLTANKETRKLRFFGGARPVFSTHINTSRPREG